MGMGRSAEQVIEDVRALDEEQRTKVLRELIVLLDGRPQEGVEEAWREEITRRADEVDAGETELVSYEEVEADVQRVVAEVRRKKK